MKWCLFSALFYSPNTCSNFNQYFVYEPILPISRVLTYIYIYMSNTFFCLNLYQITGNGFRVNKHCRTMTWYERVLQILHKWIKKATSEDGNEHYIRGDEICGQSHKGTCYKWKWAVFPKKKTLNIMTMCWRIYLDDVALDGVSFNHKKRE